MSVGNAHNAVLGRRITAARKHPLRVFATVLAIAAIAALAAGSAPVRAAPLTDPATFAQQTAEPWLARQRANGTFVDYLPRRRKGDTYGTSMMGYALLDQGIRTGSPAALEGGLRAIGFAARRAAARGRHRYRRVVFDNLALASAYNLARRNLRGNPQFERIAPVWRRALRRMRIAVVGRSNYYNFDLVEAVAMLTLLRTGLRSHRTGTVLANRARAWRKVRQLINHTVPKVARFYDRGAGTRRTTLISDPPWNPPSYQAFSLGLLARAVKLMGRRAGPSARAALKASARGSALLMAPDGDVAYYGRSQEQSWALSATMYGQLAILGFADPALQQTARATAARALARLESRYVHPPLGIYVTPSLFGPFKPALRGHDNYVQGVSYTALTLVFLEWAAHEAEVTGGIGGAIPADQNVAGFVGRGQATAAVVRTGNLWYAVTRAPARIVRSNSLYARDMRYDAGLIAFKKLGADGAWHDVMPLRPLTTRTDSAGPVVRRAGRPWRPVGDKIGVTSRGTVTIDGELRDLRGNPLGERMRMLVAPESCGVRVVFGIHAGVRSEYSLFFRRRPDIAGRGQLQLSDDHQRVFVSPRPPGLKIEYGYSSGVDAALVRARMVFKPRKTRRVSVTICGNGF